MTKISIRDDYHKLIEHWIVYGCIPKLISVNDGRIIWCNRSFEEFIGYTLAEFSNGSVKWTDITPDPIELQNDKDMFECVLSGERQDYTMVKSYRPNGRPAVRVKIHVERWPTEGEHVELFLVTVMPLLNGQLLAYETTIREVSELKTETLNLKKEVKSLVDYLTQATVDSEIIEAIRPVIKIVSRYPRRAMIVAAAVTLLLLGDAGVQTIKRMAQVFGWVQVIESQEAK